MSKVFRALSDSTRRKILQLLRERDMTAGEIAEHFEITKPTLSRHFAILKEADLIYGDKVRTTITYHLNVSVLEDALVTLLEAFDLLRQKDQGESKDCRASQCGGSCRNGKSSYPI